MCICPIESRNRTSPGFSRAASSKAGERILLAHEPRVHRREQHPILGVLGLHLQQLANGRLGLGQPREIDEGVAQAAPGKRQMGGLFERVAQQTQRIPAAAGGERDRGKAAQRRYMACIGFEDLPKDLLGLLAVVRNERRRCFLDAQAVRVGEPRTLVGDPRIRVFLKVHQHIAVGEPRCIEPGAAATTLRNSSRAVFGRPARR